METKPRNPKFDKMEQNDVKINLGSTRNKNKHN